MRLIVIGVLFTLLYSCQHGIVQKPKDHNITSEDSLFASKILSVSKNGYWLVVRGYKFTDHLVATATVTDYSHAVLIDVDNELVIEAESEGVHKTKLLDFVHKSFKITIIEPINYTEENGNNAINIANSKIGKPYDFLGTVGVNEEEKYYCSELTTYCFPYIKDSVKLPQIIKPSYLLKLGNIIYETPDRK